MISAIASLALLAAVAGATENSDPTVIEQWHFVSDQASAKFRVRLLGVLVLDGRFDALDGSVQIDRSRSLVRVTARIQTAALHMRNSRHAAWARSDEFFNSQEFPEIVFESDPFPLPVLVAGGDMSGQLVMLGVARRTSFLLEPTGCDLKAGRPCIVEASGSVRRSEFGMRSLRGTVGDRVSLGLRIVARPD